tara:strand:+ start:127 stop:399 length:273 start_codon:yes stop_codon:yes gene_type:complete
MNEIRKYNIGGVIVKTDNSFPSKFRVLKMAMDNWLKKNKNLPMHRIEMRGYRDDIDRYNKLKELFTFHEPDFIKKRHMIEVNEIFKRYND